MTSSRAGDPPLFLRQDAVRTGWSDDEIARLARASQLHRLRRGAYLELLGLPLWNVALDRVHVTRRPPACTDRCGVLLVHVARLDDEEITEVDGVRSPTTRGRRSIRPGRRRSSLRWSCSTPR